MYIIISKEEFIKFVNFITPGVGIFVVGHDHIICIFFFKTALSTSGHKFYPDTHGRITKEQVPSVYTLLRK